MGPKNEIHNYGLPKPIKTIIEDYERSYAKLNEELPANPPPMPTKD